MKRISIICVVAALISACGESIPIKLDRDFSYHKVERRDAPSHGIRLGTIAVPGHTQEVTLFLGGIPPDSPEVEGVNNDPPEVPYIFAEMNREPDLDMLVRDFPKLEDHVPELSQIALVAYAHGGTLVILTKDKVYLARTDMQDYIDSQLPEQ